MGQGTADGRHPERVAEQVALETEGPLERRDLHGRGAASDRLGCQPDHPAIDGPLFNLDDSRRVGDYEFDVARSRDPPEPRFGVQRPAIDGMARALHIGKKRLAHVAERHGLVVVERLDGRIAAVTASRPGSEHGGKDGDIGVDGRWHRPSLARRAPG